MLPHEVTPFASDQAVGVLTPLLVNGVLGQPRTQETAGTGGLFPLSFGPSQTQPGTGRRDRRLASGVTTGAHGSVGGTVGHQRRFTVPTYLAAFRSSKPRTRVRRLCHLPVVGSPQLGRPAPQEATDAVCAPTVAAFVPAGSTR
jgi:hypothetical protein